MEKIAITGANGFIGANLSNFLFDIGLDVTCIVRKNADLSLLKRQHNIVYIDYTDIAELENVLSDFKVIIHLAALTRANNFDDLYVVNVKLTEQIVRIVNKSDICNQLIFISSQAATGPSQGANPKTETDASRPINWYGETKLLAEDRVHSCTKSWTIIRPCSVYGEGDRDFLSYFQMIRRHISPVPGIQRKYISLIYVQDLVKIIYRCIGNYSVYFQVLHASDGKNYTIREFVSTLKKAMNTKAINIPVPNALLMLSANITEFWKRNPNKIPLWNKQKALELTQDSWLIDSSKTFRLLQMENMTSLYANLLGTYIWYIENRYL
jgi:nucleoside-diphosphate-sugar epimerase